MNSGPGRHDDWRRLARLALAVDRRRFLLGLALAATTVLAGIGLLGLAGWFITATALAGLQVATALVFDVFMPSAGIRLLALGRTASRYGERLLTHDATLGALAALREQVLRRWARGESSQRLKRHPARMLFRLTSDIDALETPYLRGAVPAAATFAAALLAGLLIATWHAAFGLAVFGWMWLTGWGTAWWIAHRASPTAARRALAQEALRARAADLVAGQVELVMADRLASQCAALGDSDCRLAACDDRLNRLEATGALAHGIAGALLTGAVLIGAAWLVDAGTTTAPVVALMVLATLAAGEPLGALRRGGLEAARARLAARRLPLSVDAAPVDDADEADRLPPSADEGDGLAGPAASATASSTAAAAAAGAATAAAIATVALSFVYAGNAAPSLRLPALRIARGEVVAIIGASGAGKSTLMGLIAGELRPTTGRIQTLPAASLTQRIDLFEDSIRDNLRLAAPAAPDPSLEDALAAAGLTDQVLAHRGGLDAVLGEGGLGLSGGQARRLGLARLLLADRPLWLLDEPTEALDRATAADVLGRLRQRASGHTVVIATHLRREAELADRLLRLADGHLVADLHRGSDAFEAALAALRQD